MGFFLGSAANCKWHWGEAWIWTHNHQESEISTKYDFYSFEVSLEVLTERSLKTHKMVFGWFFKVYLIRTSRQTLKLQKSYSVDNFWFLNTPGSPGSDTLVEIFSFLCLFSAFLSQSATWWLFSLRFGAKFCESSMLCIYDPRHLDFCQFELHNALFL